MQAGGQIPKGTTYTSPPRLVQRDVERRGIVRLLQDDGVRLVSVVGAPGAGKTRLAMVAAGDLDQLFADGIVFVDLSPLQEPSLVPAAIAAALGVWEAGDRDVTAALELVLRDRRLLLVLDNFEHLLPAAPVVAGLLQACEQLKVLVTSREPLRLSVERRYTVAPLAVPSESDESSLRQLARVPSVELFCLRAVAVRSDWVLDEANKHAVAELCRRLDGLPLGIELAAAWIGVLSPRALLARLSVCLNAEIAGVPDQPSRHRTLRAAIAWSYELLNAHEQAIFDRLAVFSGGWDDEAAAAVAGTTSETILPILASLVDKHLVWSAEQRGNGEPRFGLLDTLHAFGNDRLEASSDVIGVRRRHAEYFVTLAERADRALVGPDQRAWLDRLERDLGNLRAALGWAIAENEAELALRLASALWFFWDMRGHLIEGQQWLATALGMHGEGAERRRGVALNAAGWLALVQHGTYARGIDLLEQGRLAAVATSDFPCLVRAQAFLGLALALGTREHERSEDLLEAAVSNGEKLGDLWAVGLALYGLGHLDVVQGKMGRADDRWHTCAQILEGVGNLYGQSYLQFRWGVLAFVDLDLGRASIRLRASLQMASDLDITREMAVAIAALALVACAGGQFRRAARLSGIAQAFLERAGCYLPAFLNSEYERAVANVRERLGEPSFARSFEAGRGLIASDAVAEALDTGEFPLYLPLTAREWEVARLVARGLTNKEIADELMLSERTIGAHLERIFNKLEVQSRTQLAMWVAKREARADAFDARAAPSPVTKLARRNSRQSRQGLRIVRN